MPYVCIYKNTIRKVKLGIEFTVLTIAKFNIMF